MTLPTCKFPNKGRTITFLKDAVFSSPVLQQGLNRLLLAARKESDLEPFAASIASLTSPAEVGSLMADELLGYWEEEGLSAEDVAFLAVLRRG
jgi:hypothetical protein